MQGTRIKVADKIAIQTMRRHSNSQEPLSGEDLKYDARALALFISAVFGWMFPTNSTYSFRILPDLIRRDWKSTTAVSDAS